MRLSGSDSNLVSVSKTNRLLATKQQLAGRTFLVTRTKEGNAEEKYQLEKYGAKVVDYPTIQITHPSSLAKMDFAISNFENFDWVLFTSANGVKLFFKRLAKKRAAFFKESKNKKTIKFGCVGPSTRNELVRLGFRCSAMPRKYLTEELGILLAKRRITGKRFLLARAEEANRKISAILRHSGALVTEVPVYRTVSKALNATIPRRVTDATLTSPSTVEGLSEAFKKQKLEFSRIRFHCIGPITAARARELGFEIHTVARVHTIDGLISDIVNHSSVSAKN